MNIVQFKQKAEEVGINMEAINNFLKEIKPQTTIRDTGKRYTYRTKRCKATLYKRSGDVHLSPR